MEEIVVREMQTGKLYYGGDPEGNPKFGYDLGLARRYPSDAKEVMEVISELLSSTDSFYYAQLFDKAKNELFYLN